MKNLRNHKQHKIYDIQIIIFWVCIMKYSEKQIDRKDLWFTVVFRYVNTSGYPNLKLNYKRTGRHKKSILPDYKRFFENDELEELQEKHKTLVLADLNETKDPKISNSNNESISVT